MDSAAEATTVDTDSVIDEIESTVRQAAGKGKVVLIRLTVGIELSVSKVEIARALHQRFPDASIEMKEGRGDGEVVVNDIEVE